MSEHVNAAHLLPHHHLDPEALTLVRAVNAAAVPEWHTLSASEGREMYRKRSQLFARRQTTVYSVNDLVIPSAAGELGLRIYDSGGIAPKPILLYAHGGGWTFGDLDSHDELCRRLSQAAGCIVVAIDYRLAPENPFPAPLDDIMTAIDWVSTHGGDIGGVSTALALGGDSAGGNLMAAACLKLRDRGGDPRIALQLLIYPATQAMFETLSYYENAEGNLLTRSDCIWFWENYLGFESPKNPYACPAEAESFVGLPRALIITAGADPLRDEGEIYGYKLRRSGVHALTKRYPGMVHGFVGLPAEMDAGRDAVALAARELRNAWASRNNVGRDDGGRAPITSSRA